MYLIPCLDLINPCKKAMVTKGSWSCIVINTAVKANVFVINTIVVLLMLMYLWCYNFWLFFLLRAVRNRDMSWPEEMSSLANNRSLREKLNLGRGKQPMG